MAPDRFAPEQDDLRYLRERVTEALGTHYLMAYPNRELLTGRPLRTSPVHDVVAAHGATQKVQWARERGKHVVAPAWLECSCVLWRRADEALALRPHWIDEATSIRVGAMRRNPWAASC